MSANTLPVLSTADMMFTCMTKLVCVCSLRPGLPGALLSSCVVTLLFGILRRVDTIAAVAACSSASQPTLPYINTCACRAQQVAAEVVTVRLLILQV